MGSSNDHLWAERYDRDLNDIFALQDEISEAIVKALKLKLLPEEKQAIEQRGTNNVEAYNLYLMGRQLYVSGPEGNARRAAAIVRLCTRATEIDPGYARAWALMAHAQMILRQTLGKKGRRRTGQPPNGRSRWTQICRKPMRSRPESWPTAVVMMRRRPKST